MSQCTLCDLCVLRASAVELPSPRRTPTPIPVDEWLHGTRPLGASPFRLNAIAFRTLPTMGWCDGGRREDRDSTGAEGGLFRALAGVSGRQPCVPKRPRARSHEIFLARLRVHRRQGKSLSRRAVRKKELKVVPGAWVEDRERNLKLNSRRPEPFGAHASRTAARCCFRQP